MDINTNKSYKWKFVRFGGVTQVQLTSGEELLHLRELDLKLWTALSMPVNGIFFDGETAKLIDTDNDGHIKPEELLNAVDWICSNIKNPELLLEEGDSVPLEEFKNRDLASSAKILLENIKKGDKKEITLEDVYAQKKFFTEHILTVSAELSEDSTDEEKMHKILEAIIASGSYNSNDISSDAEKIINTFYEQVKPFLKWNDDLQKDGVLPLSQEQTEKALEALKPVEEKIDDFFIRCKLAKYEPKAKASLCADGENFKSLITESLSGNNGFLASLPLASIDEEKPLPLTEGINPAWIAKIKIFTDNTVTPLLGNLTVLSENNWNVIKEKLSAYSLWQKSKPQFEVSKLGVEYLKEIIRPEQKSGLFSFIEKKLYIEAERSKISDLEKLVLYRRNIFRLLNNFITFTDFYEGKGAVFQAGILYFDSRSADLCFYLTEDARHASLDPITGSFLVYCDIKRKGETKKLLAMFTNGSGNTIIAGRNGIFYDREGNDWDATVTRVIINPISLKEAFFLPYRKLSAMIEGQIAKRAADADKKSEEKLGQTAAAVASADKAGTLEKPITPKKLDLGTIALVGTAIGGISALVSGILQALFGLGFWLPAGIIGLLLLISGPSVILAGIKLRKRSIGPVLEANGWAINTQLKINIPFGGSMTKLKLIPSGSRLIGRDPFADKKTGKKWLIAIAIIIIISAIGWLVLHAVFKMNIKDFFTVMSKLLKK
ncbi:hypothetical protein [Treponema pedis]|uniref:hypothetical protein n=1 Tax=Treponema pedis TaxID=409322 RepID=UPI003133F72E